ncbi:hypothetical protein GCM10010977_13720 [Citricoccus zhacaiensis]|uniref:NifU family protein n=1 Tax=Citricoccus zhacaiensis TaxID=489142 RepID=A0ABQ2LWM8_9MICC|nr:hypothetical protein [Citricoccus zhacaiensis]GGO44095.1 hypothetical protein GCM10010977_13720 [Citricoccus zhacaiensis]
MATTTEPEAQVIDAALADFRQMMASDGYRVLWAPDPAPAPDSATEAGTRLTVTIEAGPEACADCLSPTPVMEAILQKQLAGTPYTVGSVTLPSGH